MSCSIHTHSPAKAAPHAGSATQSTQSKSSRISPAARISRTAPPSGSPGKHRPHRTYPSDPPSPRAPRADARTARGTGGTVSHAGTCAGKCGSAAGGRTSMCGRSWYPRNMIQNHIVVANTFPTRELMSAGRCNCGDQRTHKYCAVNKPGDSAPAPAPKPKPKAPPAANGERRRNRSSHQDCRTPAWRLRRTFSAAPAAPPPFSASTEASRTPTPARRAFASPFCLRDGLTRCARPGQRTQHTKLGALTKNIKPSHPSAVSGLGFAYQVIHPPPLQKDHSFPSPHPTLNNRRTVPRRVAACGPQGDVGVRLHCAERRIAATVAILSRRLRPLPTRCRCSTTVMMRRAPRGVSDKLEPTTTHRVGKG
eukprot:COSAG04_NODE_238_length_19079_cov_9.187039_4_plen_366_part_00